jgi:hypothetical protein
MARCSYVKELLSLHEFEVGVETAVSKAMLLRLAGQIVTTTFPEDRKDRYGLDRYSTEHWIGSHPDIRPCDVGPKGFHKYVTEPSDRKDFRWAMAPRPIRVGPPVDICRPCKNKLERIRALRLGEYYLLPGKI